MIRAVPVTAALIALSVIGSSARAQETSELPPKMLNAAKLAGLVGFVNLFCEKLHTDQDRFHRAIQALGVDPADLDRGALMLQARAYLAAYQKDVQASCGRADELFGQAGRIIPGIFVPQ